MRFILLSTMFLGIVFLNVSVNAADIPPSIEEYNNVKEGVLLSEESAEDESYAGSGGFRKAITIEHILSMYNAGEYHKALKNIIPLAENGQHQAEELLGVMFRMGQGVEQNNKKSFKWFLKAAEAKRPLSMHHVGIMHYLGEGVRQNIVSSLMWLKLSQLYYPEGQSRDRVKQDYDNLLSSVTRRDKKRANELVREWLELRGDAKLLDEK